MLVKLLSLSQSTSRGSKNRAFLIEALKILAAGALIIVVAAVSTSRMTYTWQWYRVPRYLVEKTDAGSRPGLLFQGLWVTLKISGLSLVLASAIGLVTALLRLSQSIAANIVARTYLELVRNTPLLVQIFLVYFVISPVLGFGRFASAVIALSLFEGAYTSEIIRGSILAVHRGQWESAYSLGLSGTDTYRFIVLPQAFRQILPPLTSQAVSLIKDSALVSTIAIYDLTMRGSTAVAETFLTFEIWFTVAAIYLVITGSLSALVSFLDKRMRTSH
jgi:polar amino acid transport system permease protein